MIIYPHWWQDDGTCELDCREWKEKDIFGYDVPEHVVERYQKAEKELGDAKQALREAISAALPINYPQQKETP